MKKVIVDCDPGIDDALAIAILSKFKDIKIELFCSVAGNVNLDKTTKNLQFIASTFYPSIKVARGSAQSMSRDIDIVADDVHSASGLGNVNILSMHFDNMCKEDAIKEMYKKLNTAKSALDILVLGPATNIAKLLNEYPGIAPKISKIYIMTGSISGLGNIVGHAEYNAFFDPIALDIVVKSKIPLIINPMENGLMCSIKKNEFLKHNITKIDKLLADMISGLTESIGDKDSASIFDPISVMGVVRPELFDFVPCKFKVTTKAKNFGQTFIQEDAKGNCYYQKIKNIDFLKKEFLKILYGENK